MSGRRRVLGIFPHPDDEAYTAGGTLAKAAAEGHSVFILCATKGEAGRARDPSLLAGEPIERVRERELAAACAALGAEPPLFLGYHDGTLDAVDLPEAVGRIVRVIRQTRPDVVITLGPDGVYGHPDHIALHKLVTPAFRSAGGGSRFPEGEFGPPHAPARLLWVAYPLGLFRPVWDGLLTSRLAEAIRRVKPESLGVTEADMHVEVEISAQAEAKLAALAAHRSQLTDGDPLSLFPAGVSERTLQVERFTIAAGERPAGRLDDIFADLS